MSDLKTILARALQRAAVNEQDANRRRTLKGRLIQKRLRQEKADAEASVDFTKRLTDRAIFRALLRDDHLDAARFRWYFEHFKNNRPIDEIRKWIDHCMTHT